MNKKLISRVRFLTSLYLVVGLLMFSGGAQVAYAAALTAKSDTMSSLKISTLANHDIQFTSPTGVASGQTIIITFPADFSIAAAMDFTDMDVLDDTVNVTLAATPAGATWGAVRTSATVITLTNGTTAVAAASVIRIKIGTNATNQSTGVRQITNTTTSGPKVIAISGTFTDTGNITVNILDDDQVSVTATVDNSLTFSISDPTIGFGTLVTANARFANGATTGTNGPTSAAAHTLAIATNAPTGYNITYNGATLTSGADTISVATITSDEDGVPGSAQFAIGFTTSGNATIATAYNQVTPTFNYSFVAGAATQIVSETVPTATETISAFYLANISGTTPAGSYSTTLTYIATANF